MIWFDNHGEECVKFAARYYNTLYDFVKTGRESVSKSKSLHVIINHSFPQAGQIRKECQRLTDSYKQYI